MRNSFKFITFVLSCFLSAHAATGYTADIDLQVSSYTVTPDPVISGGNATFDLTVQNNGPATAAASNLTITPPTNVSFLASEDCSYSPPDLTCPISSLALGESTSISYTATGTAAGVESTLAVITPNGADADSNAANDSLIKSITSINGADLRVSQTGPDGCTSGCSTSAGSIINFTLTVTNNGPDAATTFQVVNDLPATVDFTYQSAVGRDWSCSATGTTLTCGYSGAPIPSNADAPAITVTGQVITTTGTITNGVSVASTDPATGDPDETNNGTEQLVVEVTPGTDLRANKSMISNGTGLTTMVNGDAVTLTLSASNSGTQDATGVVLTDSVPTDFSIGTLPVGCNVLGQDITCSVGNLSAGNTSAEFDIPLTVTGTSGASGTNTATISRTTPAGGTDTPASVTYTTVEPFTNLTISKTKTAETDNSPGGNDPVQTTTLIVNTVVVSNSNSSTSAATGTVTVRETLNNYPDETLNALSAASASAGWTFVNNGATVDFTFPISGSLSRGASLPTLEFTTRAVGVNMNLSNQVCTGGTISAHVPPDNDTTADCSAIRTIFSAEPDIDIGITKTVDDDNILVDEDSFTYTIEVTNHSTTDTAPTVSVTDAIPMFYDGPAGTTSIRPTLNGQDQDAGEGCSVNGSGVVTCTILDISPETTREITIEIARPVLDGINITNTASWDSPDLVQTTNDKDDSDSVNVTIAPIADVTVTGIAAAPDPVKVGVELTYTTSISNNGPSTAEDVVLRHTIDPNKMAYVEGSASFTGSGATCAYVEDFSGSPYDDLAGIECTGFSLANDESRQLSFSVIPKFSYWETALPAENTYTSDAAISTTTTESSSDNNSASSTVNITTDQLDLSVAKREARGYDPDGLSGPQANKLHDPVAFGDDIKYLVTARNNGPSLATQVVITDTLTPPAGWNGTYASASINTDESNFSPTAISCSVTSGSGINGDPQVVTCYLGSDLSESQLPAGRFVTLELTFDTFDAENLEPSGSITYSNNATIQSAETGNAPYLGDTLAGNNSISETTTVLPKTDLYIEKIADGGADNDASPYNINEVFNYVLTIGNKGPSTAAGVMISDVLPNGFEPAGDVTVTLATGTNVSLVTNTCSGSPWGGTCNIGPLPADSSGSNPDEQVVIRIPVMAQYPYSGTIDADITNTATIEPVEGTSIDPIADNNSASVDVSIRKNSIAGTVYADNDRDDTIDSGEGIENVTITLNGTDSYGNNLSGITDTTDSDGDFLFDLLPPGIYTIIETQPSGYWDRFETVGTEGGNKAADTCDGIINCAGTATQNTISGIDLRPLNISNDATGYIFQEYRRGRIRGYVYHDANNNGDRGSESGIVSLSNHVTLSGTAYNGVDVQTLITETLSLNGSGFYDYSNLPPSDGSGYIIQQNNQPAGYFDGQDQTGDGTTNVVASSAGRQPFGSGANADTETLPAVQVGPNQTISEYNFGELLPASFSGSVFIDGDNDAIKDGAETAGLTGITMQLSGNDDLGSAVNTTVTTGVNGGYSFSGLRPGTYSLTQVTDPSGLIHTGAQAGNNGGTIGGVVRSAGTGVIGETLLTISDITLNSGDSGNGYNFGESGQGLSGFVYVDLDGDGIKDSGEPGIPGVTIILSGNTDGAVDVCSAISPNPCAIITDNTGAYQFTDLPASDGSGYSLTEQAQGSPPLSNYVDGTDAAGTLGGNVGNDLISNIVVPLGTMGVGYNFGELGGSLAGRSYLDVDDDGTLSAGDTGLSGVTITLSGNTSSGDDVCTIIPTCSLSSAGDGTYLITGLPAGNYNLTETQPVDYGNGTTTAGGAGGIVSTTTISSIPLGAGVDAGGYLFGEKTGAISGTVFHDIDNDGTADAGESGIELVTITLSGTTSSGADVCTTIPSCSVTTASDGTYGFIGLRNADGSGYTLTESQPTGYLDGLESQGLENGSTCSACNNSTDNVISAIPFTADSSWTAFDFGELLEGSLSGKVWHDINGNSIQDGIEPGLGQVTITLSGNDDQGNSVNEVTTTASDGTYIFTGLRPSDGSGYTLTETQPSGINDFAGSSGSLPGSGGGIAALNQISGIVLDSNESLLNNDFRENGSSLTGGSVYVDLDNDGVRDGGEPGIAGVTITLTGAGGGRCADGNTSCTVVTDGNGDFAFAGLSAGSYTLVQAHPVIYEDGRETVGSLGGVVDNTTFSANSAQNSISGINVPTATQGSGYLFGEGTGADGELAGRVWLNANPSGSQSSFDIGDQAQQSWIVELVRNGSVVATTTTAVDGTYSFTSVAPNFQYEVIFRNPVNNRVWGYPVINGGVGSVNSDTGAIDNITLPTDGSIAGLDLPIDPSGVVYESISRAPLAGAQVTINGPAGFTPATHLVGGRATQTTGSSGLYQFLLTPSAPSGSYSLSVTGPAGFVPGISSIILPCSNELILASNPVLARVQDETTAPDGGESIHDPATCPTNSGSGDFIAGTAGTLYYTSFNVTIPTSGSVIQNHLPVDPLLGGTVTLVKTSPLVNVNIGQLVPYTIKATNTLAADLSNIDIRDTIPPGFKYKTGSGSIDGITTPPEINGRVLTWANLSIPANGTRTISLLLVVGSGVQPGEYDNRAQAFNNLVPSPGNAVSNIATATVRVVPDPVFDCSDVIGKVFDDENANGYQDEGEQGIPNVRLATVRGLLITTDAEGRYHITCAMIPNESRGSTFILKLDERTLPSGYRVTTENPRTIQLTRGKMGKLNFGASIYQVIRLEMSNAAFIIDKSTITDEFSKALQSLPEQLRKAPSVIRLAYNQESETEKEMRSRLREVRNFLEDLWENQGCCYDLVFEEEIFKHHLRSKGGAK